MPGEGLELSIRDGEAQLGAQDTGVELSGKTASQMESKGGEARLDPPMLTSSRRGAESEASIRENKSISRRIKYRWSRVWLGFLFLLQLVVLVMALLSLFFTVKKGRKTWETQAQVAVIFWPMSAIFFLVIAIANPFKKGVKFELLSAAAQTTTFMATYSREMVIRIVDPEHPNRNWISPLLKVVIYGIASVGMTSLILNKRRRLKGESKNSLDKRSTRKLITQNLPITLGSVMVSILYVASESMGCLMRRKEDNVECWDVTSSNYSFSLIFVTFFFMANYAIPFAQRRVTKSSQDELTIENVYTFSLPAKEQLGLIVFIFAMCSGLALFASSDEKVELHELDEKSELYSLYYDNRKEYLLRHKPSEGWVRNFKESLNVFTTLTCILVASTTFIPSKKLKGGVKKIQLLRMRSTTLTEAAPMYIYVLYFFVFFIFSGVLVYLYYVIMEEEVQAQQLSRYCHYTWPSMSTLIAFIFFSKPRNPTASTTGVYFLLPAYLSLKGFGDSILGLGFKNAFHYQAAAMFMTLFYKVLKRARHLLSLMDDQTLELHMVNNFVRICAAMPPIMFLLFEAISCPMRYGNEHAGGAGFYDADKKEGCSDQRPPFDETFCQWAQWKRNIDQLKEVGVGLRKRYEYFSEENGGWGKKPFKDLQYEKICGEYNRNPELYKYSIEVGKDWNYTTNGLPYAEPYVNWNFQEPCPLEMCDGVGIPNLVVILHLTGMLVYWIIFGFMYKNMTWDDIATLNPDKIQFHVLFQVVAITAASTLSFFTFGTRAEDSTALVKDIEGYLLATVLVLWASCYIVQGLHLRSLHMLTEGNLEDIISAFGSGNDEKANASSAYHTAAASRTRATTGMAKFKEAAKKVQQNPSLASTGKRNRTKSNRTSLAGKPLPKNITHDVATRGLAWLDDICATLLRKYMAKAPSHYWVYTVTKFFGVHAATILLNSTFTKDRWSELATLCIVPFMEALSLVRPSEAYFDVPEEKTQSVTLKIYKVEEALTLVLFVLAAYVSYKCKRCMEKCFGAEEKAAHCIDNAFISGIITAIIPLIYVSSEAMGCLWRNYLESNGSKCLGECGGIIWGAKAFMLQATIVFMYGINVGPLITKTSGAISISRIVRLGLLWFELLEMFLVLVTTFLALWLFGSRHEGDASRVNGVLYVTLLVAWIITFSLELVKRRWDDVKIPIERSKTVGLERVRVNRILKKHTTVGRQNSSPNKLEASPSSTLRDEEDMDDDSDFEIEGAGFQTPDFAPGLV
ncbi:hypothetical protein TrRE_jg9026 [Triparma retinervis]|uniref:Uncharacterized protein n=1 Tax=Triparma retinervis TaxID=2557542 RepID=A0A9W7DS73_9STRA|nr:hypothetical protein TrRE_jg9026 [Triparma retinervis]